MSSNPYLNRQHSNITHNHTSVISSEYPTDKPVYTHHYIQHHQLLQLQYRTIHRHDIPQLQWLHNQLFPLQYQSSFYESLVLDQIPSYTVLAVIPSNTSYIDDAIIGFITVKFIECNIKSTNIHEFTNELVFITNLNTVHTKPNITAYICTIGVLSRYQRYGVAQLLLYNIESIISQYTQHNVHNILLHVHSNNKAALHMYLRYNYTVLLLLLKHYTYNNTDHNAYALYKSIDVQPQMNKRTDECVDVERALLNVPEVEHIETGWFNDLFSWCSLM